MTLFWYVLSTYQYVLVCTILRFLYRYVPVRTQYVQVRTKNPIPVQQFTIMGVRQIGEMSDKRFAGITIIDYCRGLFSNLRQSGGSREL